MSDSPIKSVVENVLGDLKGRAGQVQGQIEQTIKNILTEEEKKHISIMKLEERNLYMKVTDSVWLYEIVVNRKTDIVKQLKEKVLPRVSVRLSITRLWDLFQRPLLYLVKQIFV